MELAEGMHAVLADRIASGAVQRQRGGGNLHPHVGECAQQDSLAVLGTGSDHRAVERRRPCAQRGERLRRRPGLDELVREGGHDVYASDTALRERVADFAADRDHPGELGQHRLCHRPAGPLRQQPGRAKAGVERDQRAAGNASGRRASLREHPGFGIAPAGVYVDPEAPRRIRSEQRGESGNAARRDHSRRRKLSLADVQHLTDAAPAADRTEKFFHMRGYPAVRRRVVTHEKHPGLVLRRHGGQGVCKGQARCSRLGPSM